MRLWQPVLGGERLYLELQAVINDVTLVGEFRVEVSEKIGYNSGLQLLEETGQQNRYWGPPRREIFCQAWANDHLLPILTTILKSIQF